MHSEELILDKPRDISTTTLVLSIIGAIVAGCGMLGVVNGDPSFVLIGLITAPFMLRAGLQYLHTQGVIKCLINGYVSCLCNTKVTGATPWKLRSRNKRPLNANF